ncbi:MAG TPA: hypothetical protein VMW06_07000 [Desulfobacterales bacterium]|nr:hypothetical protein [Desulfobacterales bacterium]
MLTSGVKKVIHRGRMGFLQAGEGLLRILFVGIFLLSMVIYGVPAQGAEKDHSALVNCDIQQTSCTQELSDTQVVLDITPKPVKAMADLTFRITLTGKQPEAAPYIDLGMPGMKMGPNRVPLKSMGNGVYEGTGIIVRCPSGKKVWKATVTVPNMGAAEFVFDVIY